jgi:hypothetical protein
MSEAELVVRERKRKRTKYPFQEQHIEEAERTGSTQDEGASGIRTREVYYGIKDEIKKANDQMELQKELLRQKQRDAEERLFTARNALTNSELGNVARVVLSDQTITFGKGRDNQRRHRKIFGGLYHSDQEHTTEVEFRRSGSEEQ